MIHIHRLVQAMMLRRMRKKEAQMMKMRIHKMKQMEFIVLKACMRSHKSLLQVR